MTCVANGSVIFNGPSCDTGHVTPFTQAHDMPIRGNLQLGFNFSLFFFFFAKKSKIRFPCSIMCIMRMSRWTALAESYNNCGPKHVCRLRETVLKMGGGKPKRSDMLDGVWPLQRAHHQAKFWKGYYTTFLQSYKLFQWSYTLCYFEY